MPTDNTLLIVIIGCLRLGYNGKSNTGTIIGTLQDTTFVDNISNNNDD